MKIGVITFHNSNNYGAVLQTFALQSKIKDFGNEANVIDYVCPNKKNIYKVINIENPFSLKHNLKEIMNASFKYKKKKKIQEFTRKYYDLTGSKFYSSNEIRDAKLNYDKVICGSDQIWNYENTKFDKTYFLDFVEDNHKKISYAASFGLNKIESKYVEGYKSLLNDIESLSVREESGRKIVQEIANKDCSVVLDPTLLLNTSEWKKYCTENKDGNYILLYSLYNSREIFEIAKKLKEKTGYKIIKINTNGIKDLVSGFKCIMPDPLDFISMINNAKYIVTDSFHGTAFSLNMNKQFIVYLGSSIKNSSRIRDLLIKCNLEGRIVDRFQNDCLNTIDYKYVNSVLDNEREKSLKFLCDAINK